MREMRVCSDFEYYHFKILSTHDQVLLPLNGVQGEKNRRDQTGMKLLSNLIDVFKNIP